jgi:hypothetical protein
MDGMGAKFWSDGTIYYGPWSQGYQKTEQSGTYIRPDGSQYVGMRAMLHITLDF